MVDYNIHSLSLIRRKSSGSESYRLVELMPVPIKNIIGTVVKEYVYVTNPGHTFTPAYLVSHPEVVEALMHKRHIKRMQEMLFTVKKDDEIIIQNTSSYHFLLQILSEDDNSKAKKRKKYEY